jgi:hypothetical protein
MRPGRQTTTIGSTRREWHRRMWRTSGLLVPKNEATPANKASNRDGRDVTPHARTLHCTGGPEEKTPSWAMRVCSVELKGTHVRMLLFNSRELGWAPQLHACQDPTALCLLQEAGKRHRWTPASISNVCVHMDTATTRQLCCSNTGTGTCVCVCEYVSASLGVHRASLVHTSCAA